MSFDNLYTHVTTTIIKIQNTSITPNFSCASPKEVPSIPRSRKPLENSRVSFKLNDRYTLLCLSSFVQHNVIGSRSCCPRHR